MTNDIPSPRIESGELLKRLPELEYARKHGEGLKEYVEDGFIDTAGWLRNMETFRTNHRQDLLSDLKFLLALLPAAEAFCKKLDVLMEKRLQRQRQAYPYPMAILPEELQLPEHIGEALIDAQFINNCQGWKTQDMVYGMAAQWMKKFDEGQGKEVANALKAIAPQQKGRSR